MLIQSYPFFDVLALAYLILKTMGYGGVFNNSSYNADNQENIKFHFNYAIAPFLLGVIFINFILIIYSSLVIYQYSYLILLRLALSAALLSEAIFIIGRLKEGANPQQSGLFRARRSLLRALLFAVIAAILGGAIAARSKFLQMLVSGL